MGFGKSNNNASRGSGSFRGSSRGGPRGGSRGGGRGGYRRQEEEGPPEYVEEIAQYSHLYEDDIICKVTNEKIPYFNAPIYLENKEQIGKVEEVFGQLANPHFNLKLNDTFKNSSFKTDSKFYISPYKLLTKDRLVPQGRGAGGPKRGGDSRGGRGGAPRGGRGTFGGGRGRGVSRGGNNSFRGGDRGKRPFGGGSRGSSFAKVAKFE